MHLITGFAGTDHVTSANDGVRNAQIFGSGMHVVGIGQQLRAQIINNNTVRIYDGYGCMDGRFFEIPHNDYEEVTIDNGTQAQNRIDLICVRYEKSDTTGIETSRLVVVKGTPSASEAVAPDVDEGNILEGSIVAEYPLYQVNITGLNLSSIKALFEVYNQGFAEEVKDFQRLISNEATARANAISAEKTARETAISALTASINTEKTARANGDNYSPSAEIVCGTYGSQTLYRRGFTYSPTTVPLVNVRVLQLPSGCTIRRFLIFNKDALGIVKNLPIIGEDDGTYPPQIRVLAEANVNANAVRITGSLGGEYYGIVEYTK